MIRRRISALDYETARLAPTVMAMNKNVTEQ